MIIANELLVSPRDGCECNRDFVVNHPPHFPLTAVKS